VKVLRTIFWVLAAVGFLVFAIYNWQPVELTLWQNLVLETKVPVLVLLAFVVGFLPMWAVHRSVTWGLHRRIRALENSLKHTALARHHEPQTQAAVPSMAVDSPVEKPGTKPGEPADPLAPADPSPDTSFDGAAK
jgi:lipopolysaccharide assembly protein A